MKLSELKTNENIKLLLFGDSGCGKTCFASTFPGPIHFYDFDLKVSSAASFLKEQEKIQDISYDQYPLNKTNMGEAGRTFNYDLGKLKENANFPYRTIVIDSLTTCADRLMEYLMAENKGIKRNVTKGAQAPALQDYGLFRIFMKQFIGEVLSFPCNVIFTAHIDVKTDEQTGRILRQPMLPGKLASELNIYFEEVYRAYVEGDSDKRRYVAQTQADRSFNCRSQRRLPFIIPLTYESLVK